MRKLVLCGSIAFLLALMVGLVVWAEPTPQAVPSEVDQAIDRALAYLATQQLPNGGIDSFGMGNADPAGTAKAVMAVAAAGRSAKWIAHAQTGLTLLDFLAAQAITYTHETPYTDSAHLFPMQAGTLLAAVAAADQDPTSFGGMNLLEQISDTYIAATGAYSTSAAAGWFSGEATPLSQAWVILGLAAAGQPVPISATNWLIEAQEEDGSWAAGDPDTTALAVVALIGSGNVQPTDAPIQRALAWFKANQLPGGGWRPSWDTDPANANSTGMALQALMAAGYVPPTASWSTAQGDPIQALLGLQKGDGRIGGTYANAYSTVDAIAGLSERPLFMLGRAARVRRGLAWISKQQNADGSWSGFSGPDAGATSDAVLAYVAAGYDPDTVMIPGGLSATEYLSANVASYAAQSADRAGKLALTVVAVGKDPRQFGGVDLIDMLMNTWYDAEIGAFGVPTNTVHQAFPILALAAAGEPVPVSATQTLLSLQQEDGGWKYDTSPGPYNQTYPTYTGLAIQALVAGGVPTNSAAIQNALGFIRAHQKEDGGWDGANETAYVVQGLLAAQEEPDSAAWWVEGRSPYTALAGYQKVDGAMVWQWSWPEDNGLATWQGLQALQGLYFPYEPAGALRPYVPADAGLDPDRLVVAEPKLLLAPHATLILPYGGDLNGSAEIQVAYRPAGGQEWLAAPVIHGSGVLTATLSLPLGQYQVRAGYSDAEGVQYGAMLSDTLELEFTLSHIALPLVSNP